MPIKSTAKSKKSAETLPVEESASESIPVVKTTTKTDPFSLLIKEISQLQAELENLQKEMIQTKEGWVQEQKAHQQEMEQRNVSEELARKRDRETYEYEAARQHKKEEDEFADKKAAWEKQLREQQDTLEKEKMELTELRELVAGFDSEKEKAITDTQVSLQKELVAQFNTERKLLEQEQKAEKDLLNLKISTLTVENNRLNNEIISLKKALEEATRQVKDIAVKVIESGTKSPSSDIVAS